MSAVKKINPLRMPWETADPFLFCVHHEDFYPPGNGEMGPKASLSGRNIGSDFGGKDGWSMYHGSKVPGFPAHPHRGFETVTIARKGYIDHSDSLGAAGRFGEGDVQWMTAGKGVQHSEMFPLLNDQEDNPMELFQIWLNLPARSKMADPHFAMLWKADIPTFITTDEKGRKTEIDVIAGKIGDKVAPAPPPASWAADEKNELAIWTIRMDPEASWTIPKASAEVNRKIYFYKGKTIQIDGNEIPLYHSAQLDPTMEATVKNGSAESFLLVLQGKPIGEPVVQHGPFVANSQEEIQQAFSLYRRTEFGGWPWPSFEHVHPKESSRFAKYADGKRVEKEM